MADRIIYLDRRDTGDGMRRHRVLHIYDTVANPLPVGEPVPGDLKDILTRPDMTVEDAGVNAGNHVLRIHSFNMPAGSNRVRVEARANENFAARKAFDVEAAREDRTIVVDAQRGTEIPVV